MKILFIILIVHVVALIGVLILTQRTNPIIKQAFLITTEKDEKIFYNCEWKISNVFDCIDQDGSEIFINDYISVKKIKEKTK